jgi:DNA end-binding protein Ku
VADASFPAGTVIAGRRLIPDVSGVYVVAPRAIWKGFLKVSELAFPVALYSAATTSERIAFHTINRKTGNRVRREFIDEETERLVEREAQVKGYEVAKDQYILLEPEEIQHVVPQSDKTIRIEAFIPCEEVDTVYFDRPYFVSPSGTIANEAFTVLREGMRKKKVAALGRAVLFKRIRTVLMRPQDSGFVANTLDFDYEVRPAETIFDDIEAVKIEGEMLDLAQYIIKQKSGSFDPKAFDDRYEQALAELVKAKIAGRKIKAPKAPKETRVVDLMDALRQSAKASGKTAPARPKSRSKSKTAAPARRKAS